MTSAQSGGHKGGKKYMRRYYVCGNYQRKGKTVCKFKSFAKEPTEKVVVDTLVRELLILALPGSLQVSSSEQVTLDILRQKLKQHSEQLTWEQPEIKNQLLQQYV